MAINPQSFSHRLQTRRGRGLNYAQLAPHTLRKQASKPASKREREGKGEGTSTCGGLGPLRPGGRRQNPHKKRKSRDGCDLGVSIVWTTKDCQGCVMTWLGLVVSSCLSWFLQLHIARLETDFASEILRSLHSTARRGAGAATRAVADP